MCPSNIPIQLDMLEICSSLIIHHFILFFSGMIDPSNQHLEWHSRPQNVLIVKKHMDPDVTRQFKDMVQWLITVSIPNFMVYHSLWLLFYPERSLDLLLVSVAVTFIMTGSYKKGSQGLFSPSRSFCLHRFVCLVNYTRK